MQGVFGVFQLLKELRLKHKQPLADDLAAKKGVFKMILADKIINLRKRAGWSQEELAEQLGVSRQSISKWEGAQSIPDKDKILQLSRVFNVSTDYLLKDEIEDLPNPKEEQISGNKDDEGISVTMEDANDYINFKRVNAPGFAFGVFLCIISLIPIVSLNKNDITLVIGVILSLIIIAVAVSIFIKCKFAMKAYENYEKQRIDTAYGVKGMILEKMEQYKAQHSKEIAVGVAFCILSLIPVIIANFVNYNLIEASTCIFLFMVAVGVFIIVRGSIIWSSYNVLLEDGDYNRTRKRAHELIGPLRKIYYSSVLALFLILGFLTNDWSKTAIILPISVLIFTVVKLVILARKK